MSLLLPVPSWTSAAGRWAPAPARRGRLGPVQLAAVEQHDRRHRQRRVRRGGGGAAVGGRGGLGGLDHGVEAPAERQVAGQRRIGPPHAAAHPDQGRVDLGAGGEQRLARHVAVEHDGRRVVVAQHGEQARRHGRMVVGGGGFVVGGSGTYSVR